jgi:hypothetical protein
MGSGTLLRFLLRLQTDCNRERNYGQDTNDFCFHSYSFHGLLCVPATGTLRNSVDKRNAIRFIRRGRYRASFSLLLVDRWGLS